MSFLFYVERLLFFTISINIRGLHYQMIIVINLISSLNYLPWPIVTIYMLLLMLHLNVFLCMVTCSFCVLQSFICLRMSASKFLNQLIIVLKEIVFIILNFKCLWIWGRSFYRIFTLLNVFYLSIWADI